jgi:hypothetical protein
VRREDDRALGGDVANELSDFDDLGRVEPDRRFVEDENVGAVD